MYIPEIYRDPGNGVIAVYKETFIETEPYANRYFWEGYGDEESFTITLDYNVNTLGKEYLMQFSGVNGRFTEVLGDVLDKINVSAPRPVLDQAALEDMITTKMRDIALKKLFEANLQFALRHPAIMLRR